MRHRLPLPDQDDLERVSPQLTPDDSRTCAVAGRVSKSVIRRLTTDSRVLTPTVTAMLALVSMTGLAAAQTSSNGLCGTPAIDLFEWAAQTGAGVLFLGGLLYGGFKHARAGMSRNPERAREHRQSGTMAMISGPIFGIVVTL
ncbi:hypothetical protein [Haladaptatus sp. NG-SE-30]